MEPDSTKEKSGIFIAFMFLTLPGKNIQALSREVGEIWDIII